jgi:hypothetical protein
MVRNLSTHKDDEQKIINAGITVLDHHFDEHALCGAWCPRRRMTQLQREQSPRYYRSKVKDAKLYATLKEVLNRFVSLERLQECSHGMDTQVNESFNNSVSWVAPKNKVYCGLSSLANRIGGSIGIKSLGVLEYFKRLFKALGIRVMPNVLHYLDMKDNNQKKRLLKIKTKEAKREKQKAKFERLKETEVVAKRERAKREGSYRPGQNMRDGEEEEQHLIPPAAKRSRKDAKCNSCGVIGHCTNRSKVRMNYVGKAKRRAAEALAAVDADFGAPDAIDDVDEYDTLLLEVQQKEADSDVEDVTLHQLANSAADPSSDTDGPAEQVGVL